MQDQCYNLRLRGIRAEMLSAATSQADSKAILQRMISGGGSQTTKKGKGKAARTNTEQGQDDDEREIKLIYVRSLLPVAPPYAHIPSQVTPERIATSKTLTSMLQKAYDAGYLSRFVIDEAHCTSTLVSSDVFVVPQIGRAHV